MPTQQQYPDINGTEYDWSSAEISVRGRKFVGIKSLSYDDSLKPGIMRGAGAEMNGRSKGQYDTNSSMTMYKKDFYALIRFLGNGYGGNVFPVVANYGNRGEAIVTDELVGVRITGVKDNPQEGGEPLTVDVELHTMSITRDGLKLVPDSRF